MRKKAKGVQNKIVRIGFFISLCMMLSLSLILAFDNPEGLEDLNGDGQINAVDLMLASNLHLIPGDINKDAKADTKDLILLGKSYRTYNESKVKMASVSSSDSSDSKSYNIEADLNEDGLIDTRDLIILGKNYRVLYKPQIGTFTHVYVEPALTSVGPGEIFVINVSIDTTANVFGGDFFLYFDPSKIEGKTVEFGDFLDSPIGFKKINNTDGFVDFSISSTGGSSTGQGSLAVITFEAKSSGESDLELVNVHVYDENTIDVLINQLTNGSVNVVECEINADCDDGVSCTVDICDNGVCVNDPDDALCNNGLFCDGAETCDAELGCQQGTSIDCTYLDDECNEGVCNEVSDKCVKDPFMDGTPCNDDLFCTKYDQCMFGICGGEARDCDNGLWCDGKEVCNEQTDSCDAGTAIDCSSFDLPEISACDNNPDNNPFTFDYASEFISVCDEVNDKCTTGTQTLTHECRDNDSGDGLNTNMCGAECDQDTDCECPQDKCIDADLDGNLDDYANYPLYGACLNDCSCSVGTGQGEFCEVTITYDDGVHCAQCEINADCDDSLYCNGEETCVDGFCQAGEPVVCDNGLWCDGKEVCNEQTDSCDAGTSIDCTYLDDECNEGVCNEVSDKCVKDPFMDGAPCNDDLFCTKYDQCMFGVCGGEARDCSDEISCTVDSCNEVNDKCDNIPNDAYCDDGLYCNGEEYCHVELDCLAGKPIDCSPFNIPGISTCFNIPDDNPFTWDFRNVFTSVCDEVGNACTLGDESINHGCDIEMCDADCEVDADCGSDGLIGDEYCSTEDVYQDYREYTCEDSCVCSYEDTPTLVDDCGVDSCDAWGSNYCKDNDVYHNRTCYDRGCSGVSCFVDPYIDKEIVKICAYGCENAQCQKRTFLKGGQNDIISLTGNQIKSFNQLDTNCIVRQVGGVYALAYYEPDDANISQENYVYLDLDDSLYAGQGYFIAVEDDCYIDMAGRIIEQEDIGYLGTKKLKTGWNLMGSTTYPTAFNQGTCQLFNNIGPLRYAFDVNSCSGVEGYDGRYEYCDVVNEIKRCRCSFSPTTLQPGEGYWIRVKNDCSLA